MRRILALFTGLALVVCYAGVLRGVLDQWWHDEDMSHAFVVPVVIFFIIWRQRNLWMAIPPEPSWWGLVVLALAGCIQALSSAGAGLFVGSVAFVLSVAGAVLCLGGWPFLRVWTFPFLLSLFMLPKLAIVYNQLTLPLQLLASRLAELMLLAGRARVVREGNIIEFGAHRVEVADACSGLRYLLALGFVAVVFAYFSDAKPWMRLALLAAALPVAILANALRVAASASVPALDSGAPHAVSGWVVFVLCLAMLVMVRRFLNAAHARYHA